jgi:hypothetical protein
MTLRSGAAHFLISFVLLIFFQACQNVKKKRGPENFRYERFKDSLKAEHITTGFDTSNIFEGREFTPGVDSLDALLIMVDTFWHREAAMRAQLLDTLIRQLKNSEKNLPEENKKLKENIRMLDSFLVNRNDTVKIACMETECTLYAAINKSRQKLYLYINGEIEDSFPVSTGMKKYTTPDINVRPSGPLFTKYTSRKFPGGNYKGLGNMPYAVFVQGGYAIHGTTPGNFSRLGTVASHGCIRLHPDNARIFYELVKLFGIKNTWVTVRDSL